MKWLDVIAKAFKAITSRTKINRIAQASLAIAIALLCRKLFMSKNMSSPEAKAVLENISSFYDKLRNRQIKNVSILANSINYTDIHEKLFSADLPRHAQTTLASELR